MWKQALPTLAGGVLIIIAVVAAVWRLDLHASETMLALFGAALIAAPFVTKIKSGGSGGEFETKIKAVAFDISDVLDHHEKAVKVINGCLTQVNCCLDELQASQRALIGEIVKTKDVKITEDNITIFTVAVPKTDEISQALAANDALLATASDIRKKLTDGLP
jgi:hypothetical protein